MATNSNIFATVPEGTWVVLRRTTGVHEDLDPKYRYSAEIGYHDEWTTGEQYSITIEEALRTAVLLACTTLNLSESTSITEPERSPAGRLWMETCLRWMNAKHLGESYRQAFLYDLLERIELEYPAEVAVERNLHLPNGNLRGVKSLHQIIVQVPESPSHKAYQLSWDWDKQLWVPAIDK